MVAEPHLTRKPCRIRGANGEWDPVLHHCLESVTSALGTVEHTVRFPRDFRRVLGPAQVQFIDGDQENKNDNDQDNKDNG